MKNFFTICLLGLFSVTLTGCGENDEIPEKDQDTNIEISEQKKFFSILPEDWSIISSQTYKNSVVFAAEEPSQIDDIDTLVAVSQYSSSPNSLESFTRRSLENIRKVSQDFLLLSREDVTLASGDSAKYIAFSDRVNGGQEVHYMTLFTLSSTPSQPSIVTIRFDPNTTDSHKEFLKTILLSYTP